MPHSISSLPAERVPSSAADSSPAAPVDVEAKTSLDHWLSSLSAPPPSTLALSFLVGGMSCASCAMCLSTALQQVSGVVSASVNFLSQQADVVVCAQENAAVAAAVQDCVVRLGYTVLGSTTSQSARTYTSNSSGSLTEDVPRTTVTTKGPRAEVAATTQPLSRGSTVESFFSAVTAAPMRHEGVRAADAELPLDPTTTTTIAALGELSSSEDYDGADSETACLCKTSGEGACCCGSQCCCSPSPPLHPQSPPPALARTRLLIEGMSCSSCAARVERELRRLPGVKEATVNFTILQGSVVHEPRRTTAAELVRLVESLGYTPSLQSNLPLHHQSRVAQRSHTNTNTKANAARDNTTSISILIDDDNECSSERWHGRRESRLAGRATNTTATPTLTPTSQPQKQPKQSQRREGREIDSIASDGGTRYVHRFLVEGMSCASCAARIERTVADLPCVAECTVSFATGTACVTTSHNVLEDNAAVKSLIESLGYTVTALGRGGGQNKNRDSNSDVGYDTAIAVHESSDETSDMSRTRTALERKQEIAKQRSNFINSAILCIPLAIAMLIMAFTDLMDTNRLLAWVVDGVQLLCATPIVLIFGRQFFTGAWRSFQHGAYTMDTLVAIGTGCSYAYSVVAFAASLLTGAHVMTYFDTAGMLTAFMLLGRYLEASAKRYTSGALIELMSLVPPMATVVTADGADVRVVASSALQVGDHVRVLAGDRVPVDGTVREGQSDIDEQLVTGESVPKPCGPGSAVVGGTLNVTATLLLVVDKVGEDTLLAQILRIVQEAQSTKPAVQRVADRMAMYFVPFVVLTSLVTLVTWLVLGATSAYPASWRQHGTSAEAFALNFFIATVVAACPCALGLATPTAIMVGTGVGAQNGVLVKSGVTLESVRKADCVVFDKTGTITNGQLRVTAAQCFHVASGPATTLLRRLVAAVEAQSTHPIAKAVAIALTSDSNSNKQDMNAVEVLAAVTHAGRGVEATVAVTEANTGGGGGQYVHHYSLLVGNLLLLEEHAVKVSAEVREAVRACSSSGQTTVVAAVDGTAVLVLALADEPKAEARAVVAFLHEHGVRTLMVTGDNRHVAAAVASAVGIAADDVKSEALPATKAEIVKSLQAAGHRVMFVGDGMNDSPALAQADVGVALGAGTEVAIEAADAVLVRNSLVDLLSLRGLSAVTVRRIYGNFAWAFGYNLVMLPLASGLLYPVVRFQLPPVVAGAAMVLSSLSVLTSSLTIRCFKPYKQTDFI